MTGIGSNSFGIAAFSCFDYEIDRVSKVQSDFWGVTSEKYGATSDKLGITSEKKWYTSENLHREGTIHQKRLPGPPAAPCSEGERRLSCNCRGFGCNNSSSRCNFANLVVKNGHEVVIIKI